MAGAASLQRDRDRDREFNSQSELSQIAAGYTKSPQNSNANPVGAPQAQSNLPTQRNLAKHPHGLNSASNNSRVVRNISRSQAESVSGVGAINHRDSISIDRKGKLVNNSSNSSVVNQANLQFQGSN